MADHWSNPYRPLRITAHLASPVACVPGEVVLPLDGILEYASFQAGWPHVLKHHLGRYLPRIDSRDPANFLIPVKRWGHRDNPDWFWCASQAEFPGGLTIDRSHWNKRFDGTRPEFEDHLSFEGRRGKVVISSGRYKSYHMPLCLLVAPRIEWHCLGAADGVGKLLQRISHLGHKRSQGWGEVLRWEIHAARHDRSLFRADGSPARALPLSCLPELGAHADPDMVATAPVRSPAWHASRRRHCLVPRPLAPSEI